MQTLNTHRPPSASQRSHAGRLPAPGPSALGQTRESTSPAGGECCHRAQDSPGEGASEAAIHGSLTLLAPRFPAPQTPDPLLGSDATETPHPHATPGLLRKGFPALAFRLSLYLLRPICHLSPPKTICLLFFSITISYRGSVTMPDFPLPSEK